MLPILSVEQMRDADAFTVAHEPIASIDLMERAAKRCTDWMIERSLSTGSTRFVVVCGMGNNGGDGLAIARLLKNAGSDPRVIICRHRPDMSVDTAINVERAQKAGVQIDEADLGSGMPMIAEDEVVIDALLGIGLDRPVSGWMKQVIAFINALPNEVVSIDMPSGLFVGDNISNDAEAIMRADHVLTFETPKLAMLLPENDPFVGRWHVLPIGLDQGHINSVGSRQFLLVENDVVSLMPAKSRFAHKGTFGHALLIVGGPGKMGAAVIATKACARSGTGLTTVHVPAGSEQVIHVAAPEAMVSCDGSTETLETLPKLDGHSAIGVGPGIGTSDGTARMIKLLIQEANVPLVLDADAINILSANKTWIAFLPKASILTPHPKEFDRLAGPSSSGYERLMKAIDFAVRSGLVLVLKGAYTAICAPDGKVFFNPTGNPGMAKGGSGDALTGIMIGLCAQGLDPLSAAILGVYAHGLAGDLAAEAKGMDGMTVSDLIDHLPFAWKRLRALDQKRSSTGPFPSRNTRG